MSGIKFGTDGWRAVVGKDFNAENVEIVSNAIGKYVFENYGIYKTIIVGYDPRNMAREFSMQCAEIFKKTGALRFCTVTKLYLHLFLRIMPRFWMRVLLCLQHLIIRLSILG